MIKSLNILMSLLVYVVSFQVSAETSKEYYRYLPAKDIPLRSQLVLSQDITVPPTGRKLLLTSTNFRCDIYFDNTQKNGIDIIPQNTTLKLVSKEAQHKDFKHLTLIFSSAVGSAIIICRDIDRDCAYRQDDVFDRAFNDGISQREAQENLDTWSKSCFEGSLTNPDMMTLDQLSQIVKNYMLFQM